MSNRDFDWGASYKPPKDGGEWQTPPSSNNGNGYAKIREVYQLLRESEERIDVRLREMEARLMGAIESLGVKQTERWERHDNDFSDIRTQLKNIEQTETLTSVYQTALQDAVSSSPPPATILKRHIKALGRLVDYIERHWRILMFVLLLLTLLLGLTDVSEVLK